MSFCRAKNTSSSLFSPSLASIQDLEGVLDFLNAGTDSGSSCVVTRDDALRIVRACKDLGADFSQCRRIHAIVQRMGLSSDVVVGNLMVNMHIRCGNLQEARSVFEEIRVKDAVSWTAMVSGYASSRDYARAFDLFRKMQIEGVRPDSVTLGTMINACSRAREGKELQDRASELGLVSSSAFVGTALINMYGKLGDIDLAEKVFREMERANAVPWNAMIAVYTRNGHCEEAIALLREMHLESVFPSGTTFVAVLNACSSVLEGIQIHDRVLESGHGGDVIVATALLNMYGRVGCSDRALEIFLAMPERNVVTWNAMVTLLARNEQFQEAFWVFYCMQVEGIKPSEATFLGALPTSNLASQGRLIHKLAKEAGFLHSILVCTALIEMYGRTGLVEEAVAVFESVTSKDVVFWNAMIAAFVQAGDANQALQHFQGMQAEGVSPNSFSFITIFNACSSPDFALKGTELHSRMVESGLTEDVFLGTALVNMYGKSGGIDNSHAVFHRMKHRSLVTWNAMIGAYMQQGNDRGGVWIFQQMQQDGIKPDKLSFLSILAGVTTLGTGKIIHGYMLETSLLPDSMLESALVSMYNRTGGLDLRSRWMFDHRSSIIGSGYREVSWWNTIVTALARHGKGSDTLRLLHRMQVEGTKPTGMTFMGVLSGCSHSGLLREGIECFWSMVWDHGMVASQEHYGCVIDLLGRAGRLEEAEKFIAKMPLDSSSVVWMSVLGASKVQGDAGRVKQAADKVISIDPFHNGAYVALAT